MQLHSPNDFQAAAIKNMLDGEQPTTTKDWQLCANFWAFNAAEGLEREICKLMRLMFSCPLSEADVIAIADYQAARKDDPAL